MSDAERLVSSPVDEYERGLAERGRRAGRRVVFWYCLTLVPYVGGPATLFLWPGLPMWVARAFVAAFVGGAGATGVATLRHWSVLQRDMRVLGLAPWAMCVLTAGPILLSVLFG